jgi:CCR4-NOT transcription complex subunit 7/8
MECNQRPKIIDVWAYNLEHEFENMLRIVEKKKCSYIAMDTEFPGIVITNSASKRYTELRCNVDALSLIQLGLAFADESGWCSPDVPVWQFNFSFDVQTELHATESIELLQHAGLDFCKHQEMGIKPQRFGELLMQSGLVLSDQFQWICFHGCYDFAYLIKVLTGAELPTSLTELVELLDLFFPRRGDVKLLAKPLGHFGSLLSIAEQRGISCDGIHQGGFDAMLTRDVYFSLPDSVRACSLQGDVFGLEDDTENTHEEKELEPDSGGNPEWGDDRQEWPRATRYLEAPRTPPLDTQYGVNSGSPHQYQHYPSPHHNQYPQQREYNGYDNRGYGRSQTWNGGSNQYIQDYAYNRGYPQNHWGQREYQYRRPNVVPAY